jgi:hypothetical protein
MAGSVAGVDAIDSRANSRSPRSASPQPAGGQSARRRPGRRDHVAADEDWEIEPSRIAFALQPGEVQDIRLDIRQPRNQPAGRNTVHAHIQLHSDPKYLLDIPLRFEIGLADVDVWGYAINEGDRVRVRHGVTNRSSERLSFRAFAMLEGAPRQYRRFDEILPGQTLSLEYLFGEASDATGKAIRLGLREVNGRRRHNLETRVP